jgi:hypothetical protein
MNMNQIQIKLTKKETAELMSLKDELGYSGFNYSTSQAVALAVASYLRILRTLRLHADELSSTTSSNTHSKTG